MPVVKTSYSFELFRRLTSVAQSTTCRSILKPMSSSCCLVSRAQSYIHLYSCFVMNRIGSFLYPDSWSRRLALSLLCSFHGSPASFVYHAVISTGARLE